MSAALLSGHWFRLASLRPRLRGHVRIHRHVYRGCVWYVVHDRISGLHHRFNGKAYEVIRQLDGRHSMQQIWDQLIRRLRDDSPTQTEIVQVLGQLNAADLLLIDATPDVAELIERRDTQRRRKFLSRFMNPMAMRFPLWDPDRFLGAATTWIRPLPVMLAVLLWLVCVLPALLMVPAHWPELTRNFSEQLLSSGNLWVMAVAFPLLKAVHELAHGFALKRGGGEVHEMGLMFLLFYPIPYVDASGAHAFASRGRRIWVGSAGMVAEVAIAALAFHVWLLVEPGLLRAVAYNMLVLGSVTTVLFNANPLLRYDGYYILSDLIEIPNLAQRSTRYWQYLATRYLFGVRSEQAAWTTQAERRWFLWYAPAAFAYRMFVTLGIAWFIAQQYFVFGLLLAIWSIATGVLLPVGKALKALFTTPVFVARSSRVWLTLSGTIATAAALLFMLPAPYHSRAEGVVWLPERALLRAGSDGLVHQVTASSGAAVESGQPVLEMVNLELDARVAEQVARVDEVQGRLDAAWSRPAEAARLSEALTREEAVLHRVRDDLARLVARPQVDGRLVMDRAQDLPGRFLRQGELIGHVVGPHEPVVRVVVEQADVDRVRNDLRRIEVRLTGDLSNPLAATLSRSVPKAARELPSPALGSGGGGRHVIDPRDEKQTTALDALFEFEVALPAAAGAAEYLGRRAYVSFEHSPEAIGWRWLRAARRQLLSKLDA